MQLAFINQRHVTEANLNDAITTVVNAYAQFHYNACGERANQRRRME